MDWRTFVLFLHGRSFIPCPCVEGNWCKQLCIATGFSFKVSTLTNQEYSRVRIKVYFLQIREVIIMSRELMFSANLIPNLSMV